MLDFSCLDVGIWLVGGCCILVIWTLDFGCVDVEFWLFGRWIFVGWMLDFCCLDVGLRLCES